MSPTPSRRKDAPGRWIEHLTLTTGHTRRSYRSEVGDDVVAYCRNLLDGAIAAEPDGKTVPITSIGCDLGVIATSRSILCTILHSKVPLVSVGIATSSRSGASLWRVLTQVGEPILHHSIVVDRCPAEPWCVVRLEPGVVTADRELASALGDFERCLAWAFIERVEGQH